MHLYISVHFLCDVTWFVCICNLSHHQLTQNWIKESCYIIHYLGNTNSVHKLSVKVIPVQQLLWLVANTYVHILHAVMEYEASGVLLAQAQPSVIKYLPSMIIIPPLW